MTEALSPRPCQPAPTPKPATFYTNRNKAIYIIRNIIEIDKINKKNTIVTTKSRAL